MIHFLSANTMGSIRLESLRAAMFGVAWRTGCTHVRNKMMDSIRTIIMLRATQRKRKAFLVYSEIPVRYSVRFPRGLLTTTADLCQADGERKEARNLTTQAAFDSQQLRKTQLWKQSGRENFCGSYEKKERETCCTS